jgi:hypothetical protein
LTIAILDLSNGSFIDHFYKAEAFTTVEAFEKLDFNRYSAVAVNGHSNADLLELPYTLVEKLWKYADEGGLVYGELVRCYDFPSSRLFGFRQDFPITNRRLEKLKLVPAENIIQGTGDYNLLEWNGPYQTGFSVETSQILEIGIFSETHHTASQGSYPGLSVKKHGKGTVIYSTFSLFSNPDTWSFRPNWIWNHVLDHLNKQYGLPVISLGSDIHFKKQSAEDAVRNSIKWFMSSGIMGSDQGTNGVYENIHSFRRSVSMDMRPDCNSQSALMFYLYGDYTGEAKWKDISSNIINYLFTSGFQDQDCDSASFGLWKWFQFPGKKPDQMFTDDNAWVTLVLLYLYRKTGNEDYKTRGMQTASAMLKTQNKKSLRVEVLRGAELEDKGSEHFANSYEGNMNPHFQSIAHAAFLQAYLVSNDRAYLDTALKGTMYMLEHPEELEFMYSKTSGLSRFLLGLSQVYALTKDENVKLGMYKVLGYLEKHMNESGGIEEADNPAPERYGTEDTGVFLFNGEGIADQLYTNNFLAMNIWEAWKATGDPRVLSFYKKISAFLADIQIQADDNLIDGGWMRSYHFASKEYFGNNGDTGWGPYCIESGWTNGVITSGLLLSLLNVSLLD